MVKRIVAMGLMAFGSGLILGTLALLSMRILEAKTPTGGQVCRWYIPLAKMAYNRIFRETSAPPGITNDGWCRDIITLSVQLSDS